MLIKSECQPLDKTRHKPAWNLFEQREPCKMAREICRAAWPLNSARQAPNPHPHPLSSLPITCPERDRRIQTDGERRGGIHKGPTSSVLSQGDISPVTLWVNTRAMMMAGPCSPSLTCARCLYQISLTITELEARHMYVLKSQAL